MISLSGQNFLKNWKCVTLEIMMVKEQDWQMSKTFQFFYKTK